MVKMASTDSPPRRSAMAWGTRGAAKTANRAAATPKAAYSPARNQMRVLRTRQ